MRGIAYHYDEAAPIETIPALADDPELLKRFLKAGHERFAMSHCSIIEQAVLSAQKTLDAGGTAPQDIDAVVIGTSELRAWKRYPETFAAHIMLGVGVKDIFVTGVTLGGCANNGAALRAARNLILAEGFRNVLVIETNQVRGDLERVHTSLSGDAAYILGDGAVSCIVSPERGEFRLLGIAQLFKPLDHTASDSSAFVNNNCAGVRGVVDRALAQAGVGRDQVDKVFFHNIKLQHLVGFMQLIDIPVNKCYMTNVWKTAHVWSADNLIGLHDFCAEKNPPAGSRFLMVCQANAYFSAVVCEKMQ